MGCLTNRSLSSWLHRPNKCPRIWRATPSREAMMFTIDDAGSAIAAVSALGTAAFGLVDATKVFGGGVSRAGFGYVDQAVRPYISFTTPQEGVFGTQQIIDTLRANWMNGMAKADQKAAAKSLIRLMVKPDTA